MKKERFPKAKTYFDAVSYRLPMMVTEMKVYWNGSSYYVCPRCKITMEREFSGYCDRCGQKLGWKEYRKAKII